VTAKDKAYKLVCNMYGCEDDTDLHDIYLSNNDGYFLAISCAIVCVNEILDASMLHFDDFNGYVFYWQAVKQELLKF